MALAFPRPGSSLWFIRHEMRLHWRRSKLGRWRVFIATVLGLSALLYHVPALAMASIFARAPLPMPQIVAGLSLLLAFAFALMMSQSLKSIVESLYERGDLDWLRATPIPLRRVLLARMLGIALNVVWPWLLFCGPAANAMAFYGHPEMLALYPTLLGAALLATAAGTALTVGCAASIGLRRTRAVALMMAMLTASCAFVATQSQTLLSPATRSAIWRAMLPAGHGSPAGAAWWPAQAVLGEPGPLAAVIAAGVGAALLTSFALERRFAASAMTASRAGPRGDGGEAPRFAESARWILVRKELRLIARAPGLIGKTMYKLVYLMPLAVMLLRGTDNAVVAGLATLPVFFIGELARLFMTTAISADEAGELARTAPIQWSAVRSAKIYAVCIGIVAMGIAPVLAIAALVPGLIPAMLLGTICVAVSEIMLGLWKTPPARRQDLGGGHDGFSLADWVGTLISIAWSSATWLALHLDPLAAIPAAMALGLLTIAKPRPERAGIAARQARPKLSLDSPLGG